MKTMSIKEKLNKVTNLALTLAYEEDACINPIDTDELYGKEISDRIWIYADGLAHKRLEGLINGRASLSAIMEFNLADEEKYLDSMIKKLLYLCPPISECG